MKAGLNRKRRDNLALVLVLIVPAWLIKISMQTPCIYS